MFDVFDFAMGAACGAQYQEERDKSFVAWALGTCLNCELNTPVCPYREDFFRTEECREYSPR